MKAIVDGSLCAGHARCVFEAPEVYELDDLGYNSTTIDPVPPGLEDKARRGADACPERAISIQE
ncbi:ferredoxin [Granulicoccus phenolivorans]|uniref:ferredoxin n=1 Tax=Granulicoccus phenolivorans TaxID=266854 RepID=UPI0004227354|nr:ferredoxin [Granulicoccus phenolivorans]